MKSKKIAPKPPQNPTPEQADGIYPTRISTFDQGSIDTSRFSESPTHSSSPYNTPRMSINQGHTNPPYPTHAAPYPTQAPYPENIQRSAPYPAELGHMASPPPPYEATQMSDINVQFRNQMYIGSKSSAPPENQY